MNLLTFQYPYEFFQVFVIWCLKKNFEILKNERSVSIFDIFL